MPPEAQHEKPKKWRVLFPQKDIPLHTHDFLYGSPTHTKKHSNHQRICFSWVPCASPESMTLGIHRPRYSMLVANGAFFVRSCRLSFAPFFWASRVPSVEVPLIQWTCLAMLPLHFGVCWNRGHPCSGETTSKSINFYIWGEVQ